VAGRINNPGQSLTRGSFPLCCGLISLSDQGAAGKCKYPRCRPATLRKATAAAAAAAAPRFAPERIRPLAGRAEPRRYSRLLCPGRSALLPSFSAAGTPIAQQCIIQFYRGIPILAISSRSQRSALLDRPASDSGFTRGERFRLQPDSASPRHEERERE